MEYVRQIIHRKPTLFLTISLVYLLLVLLFKWQLVLTWNMFWFMGGGLVGVYFLDAAEIFFALSPSPFRSVVFLALYVVVSFFVVSSSGSAFASGLVLSLYIQLLLWQIGEWRLTGALSSWYRMVTGSVPPATQRIILILFGLLLFVETYIFIRA